MSLFTKEKVEEAATEVAPESVEPEPERNAGRGFANMGAIPDMIAPEDITPEMQARVANFRSGHHPDAVIPRKGYTGTKKAMDPREAGQRSIEIAMSRSGESVRLTELKRAMADAKAMSVVQFEQHIQGLSQHQQHVLVIAEKLTRARSFILQRHAIDPQLEERYTTLWAQTGSS